MANGKKLRFKLKVYQCIIGLLLILFLVTTCYAAVSEPSWTEHVDLMTVLIGSLFLAVTWFAIKTLRTFESNQDLLFSKFNTLNDAFHELKGKCDERSKC
jgi:FtsH-binding integral membrane protein